MKKEKKIMSLSFDFPAHTKLALKQRSPSGISRVEAIFSEMSSMESRSLFVPRGTTVHVTHIGRRQREGRTGWQLRNLGFC